MILESTFRFKFTFAECKTYEDVFEMLKYLENYFKTLKSLGVEKLDQGVEDDYHQLEIETKDFQKIKKLKDMGFMEMGEEGELID